MYISELMHVTDTMKQLPKDFDNLFLLEYLEFCFKVE